MKRVSKIDINTVLSTHYLAADYFAGYRTVTPVSGEKNEMDYLVGTDSLDRIHIAYPKNKGETGYVTLDTGESAKLFDVESGIEDDILLAYEQNKKIKISSFAGAVRKHTCEADPALGKGEYIEKLITYRRDFVLYVFILYKAEKESVYRLTIIEHLLPDWTYNTIRTGFTLTQPQCDCLRNNLSVQLVGFDDTKYRSYDLFMKEEHETDMNYPGKMLCFSALNTGINGEGMLALFDVNGRKKLYALYSDTMEWNHVNLQLNADPQELHAVWYKGFFHVFVSAKKDGVLKLYHAARTMDDTQWTRELVMMPISGEITDFAINKAEQTRLGVIFTRKEPSIEHEEYACDFLSAGQSRFEYIVMTETGSWSNKGVVVDSTGDQVYEEKCFATRAVFYDADGAVYPELEVDISAECTAQIVINSRTYTIVPGEWTTVHTNALGQLHLVQRTGELSTPDIKIKPKDGSAEEYCIVQHDKFSKRFEAMTEEQLQNAKLDDGTGSCAG